MRTPIFTVNDLSDADAKAAFPLLIDLFNQAITEQRADVATDALVDLAKATNIPADLLLAMMHDPFMLFDSNGITLEVLARPDTFSSSQLSTAAEQYAAALEVGDEAGITPQQIELAEARKAKLLKLLPNSDASIRLADSSVDRPLSSSALSFNSAGSPSSAQVDFGLTPSRTPSPTSSS